MSQFKNATPVQALENLMETIREKFNSLRWWQRWILGGIFKEIMDLLEDVQLFVDERNKW